MIENGRGHSVEHRSKEQPPITDHARSRWAERVPGANIKIEAAWRQSIRVPAPERDCTAARLYAPGDVLLLLGDGVIKTVYPADIEGDSTALAECSQCGDLDRFTSHHPECRWCGFHPESIQTASGVAVTFAGGD